MNVASSTEAAVWPWTNSLTCQALGAWVWCFFCSLRQVFHEPASSWGHSCCQRLSQFQKSRVREPERLAQTWIEKLLMSQGHSDGNTSYLPSRFLFIQSVIQQIFTPHLLLDPWPRSGGPTGAETLSLSSRSGDRVWGADPETGLLDIWDSAV